MCWRRLPDSFAQAATDNHRQTPLAALNERGLILASDRRRRDQARLSCRDVLPVSEFFGPAKSACSKALAKGPRTAEARRPPLQVQLRFSLVKADRDIRNDEMSDRAAVRAIITLRRSPSFAGRGMLAIPAIARVSRSLAPLKPRPALTCAPMSTAAEKIIHGNIHS